MRFLPLGVWHGFQWMANLLCVHIKSGVFPWKGRYNCSFEVYILFKVTRLSFFSLFLSGTQVFHQCFPPHPVPCHSIHVMFFTFSSVVQVRLQLCFFGCPLFCFPLWISLFCNFGDVSIFSPQCMSNPSPLDPFFISVSRGLVHLLP